MSEEQVKEKCKKAVSRGTWSRVGRCHRNAVKDGYCKQHHPDAADKRKKESDERYAEKQKLSPYYKLKQALESIKELESKLATIERDTAEKLESLYPAKCPITRRDFFMVIEHPEDGVVPTYGGPFDSFTIPEMGGEIHEDMHERELSHHRYDHDAGCWVEDETIPLRVIHEDNLGEKL